jgi:hypothetical protein
MLYIILCVGLFFRLATVTTSDWSQEQQLVSDLVVNIQKPIPKRDEINTFIKR